MEYASYGMDMLCIIMDMASMAWSIFRGMLDIADPRQHKLVARRTEQTKVVKYVWNYRYQLVSSCSESSYSVT